MAFNVKKFKKSKFKARTKTVPVPALADFFDGTDALWTVRGLEAGELQRCLDSGKRNSSVENIVKLLAAGDSAAAAAVKEAIGLSNETPAEIAKRLDMIVVGSVDPVIDIQTAVKLSKTFPMEFMSLTNEIYELTGRGFDVEKPEAASTATMDSTQQCDSSSSEAASSTSTDQTSSPTDTSATKS